MALTNSRTGELLILSQTFVWGALPIVTTIMYATLPNLIALAWSIFFAILFFLGVVIYRKTWRELKSLQLWKYCLAIAFFNGVLYYSFYFIGLSKTLPGNAGIIGLFEIFTSYAFFHMIRKEHITKEHILGAALMIAGVLIVLWPRFSGFNSGDLFILAACVFAPGGNFYMQKARKIATSENIMLARSIFTFPIVLVIAAFMGQATNFTDLKNSLLFLVLNGVIIFGLSKIFWVEGIHRIAVTKALALGSISALFTLLFAWIFLSQHPTIWQLSALLPMILGVCFLTDQLRFNRSKAASHI